MRVKHTCTLLLLLLSIFAVACQSAPAKKEQPETQNVVGDTLSEAKRVFKLDDYREFEKVEFRFLAIRMWRTEDVEVAGWLAQLYVAWWEQLGDEIAFLKAKKGGAERAGLEKDAEQIQQLITYREAKAAEVKENARNLCNYLRAYHPTHYMSHRVLADYFRVMGDREQMENQLLVVQQLNPDSVGLKFLQGALLADFENNYITAIPKYDEALVADPDFVKALYFKGLAQHQMGREKMAVETMEAVLEKSPNHPGAKAYLDAEKYLAGLTKEVDTRLKYAKHEEGVETHDPHMVYWVANWSDQFPQLLYRIAAPTERDVEIKLKISLVLNETNIVQSFERVDNLEKKSFRSFSQAFLPPQLQAWDELEIIIQLWARAPGEKDYQAVSVRRALLPRMKE